MELIIIFYAGLLAYILIQRLRGRGLPWNSTGTEDVPAEEMRPKNQPEHTPAIKLVLQKEPDNMPPDLGETTTLLLTDRDFWGEEGEIIDEDEVEGPTHPDPPS